jgi:hypothetical protein
VHAHACSHIACTLIQCLYTGRLRAYIHLLDQRFTASWNAERARSLQHSRTFTAPNLQITRAFTGCQWFKFLCFEQRPEPAVYRSSLSVEPFNVRQKVAVLRVCKLFYRQHCLHAADFVNRLVFNDLRWNRRFSRENTRLQKFCFDSRVTTFPVFGALSSAVTTG